MPNGQSERDAEAVALMIFNAMVRAVDEQLGLIGDLLSHLERVCHPDVTDR